MENTESNIINCYKKVNYYIENLESDPKLILEQFDKLNEIMKEITRNSMFSGNEEFKEIPFDNLKYLMIPFYQAELLVLLQNENREKNLKLALQFYNEFYKILKTYKYLDKKQDEKYKILYEECLFAESKGKENSNNYDKLLEDEKNNKKKINLEIHSKSREEKIEEFKYKKLLLDKLKALEKKQEENTQDYWIIFIELNWKKMLENLLVLKSEFDCLSFLAGIKKNGKIEDFRKKDESSNNKFEYLKITPDNIKTLDPNNKIIKNVVLGDSNCGDCTDLNQIIDGRINYKQEIFKNGNPTTMTLDEFADKQIVLMEEGKRMEEQAKQNKIKEENLSDEDELVDEKRKKEKRAWDDWKDLNEKGGGNKMGNK